MADKKRPVKTTIANLKKLKKARLKKAKHGKG